MRNSVLHRSVDWFRKLLSAVILVIISLISTVASMELILRFTSYDSLRNQYIGLLPQSYLCNDPVMEFDNCTNRSPLTHEGNGFVYETWSNELGCFDKPYKGEDNYILLLGDSFTWGFTSFDEKWGSIIEKMLGMRVLKCGVTGYGTIQELAKLEKVSSKVSYRPRLITLGYYIGNDLEDDLLSPRLTLINGYLVDTGYVDRSTGKIVKYDKEELKTTADDLLRYGLINPPENRKVILKFKRWLSLNSVIYNLLRRTGSLRDVAARIGIVEPAPPDTQEVLAPLPFIVPQDGSAWLDQAWHDHLMSIRLIKNAADRIGAELLVVLIPMKMQIYDFLKAAYKTESDREIDWNFPNEKLKSFLEGHGIRYLDLTPIFREYADNKPRRILDSKEDLYWSEDSHWNTRGNLLAGLSVSKYILEHGLAGTEGSQKRIDTVKAELMVAKERRSQ